MTIKEFMQKNKVKLQQIADETHFSVSYISKLTKGFAKPNKEFIDNFERAYGFKPEEEIPAVERARRLLDEKDAEIAALKAKLEHQENPVTALLSKAIDEELNKLKNKVLFKIINDKNIFDYDKIRDIIKETLEGK